MQPNGSYELIRKYLDEHPNVKKKRAIAKELMLLYPDTFTDLERTRVGVRYVTGSMGEKARRDASQNDKYFFSGFEQWANENLNTEHEPWKDPFIIPEFQELNIISDLHSVFLDKDVMMKFLRATKNKEALLVNGDLLDSSSLSRHLKVHNTVAYDQELEICHQILKGLKEEFTHVYFKEGNHDFWLERYLLTNAREIFKVRGMTVKELLRVGELGVHHIHNLQYIKYGDLDIIHAHEFPGFGLGKFPATGLLDKWQSFKKTYEVKILGAHCHRADRTVSRKSKDGKFGQAWVMAAMCQTQQHYAPYAGTDQGWANVKLIDGEADVQLTVL